MTHFLQGHCRIEQQSNKRTSSDPFLTNSAKKRQPAVDLIDSYTVQTDQSVTDNRSRGSCSEDLINVLNKTGTGRYLLALSKKASSLKHERDQNKLAEIIIEHKITVSPT